MERWSDKWFRETAEIGANSLKMEKPEMICCRRPKLMEGCSVRRSIIKYICIIEWCVCVYVCMCFCVSCKGTFRWAIKIAYCWKYFPTILPGNIAGNMRQLAIFSAIIARQLLQLYIAGDVPFRRQ